MTPVYISIGSNVDREYHIRAALADLTQVFGPLRVSPIYESAAVGFIGDPFYNLVVSFYSDLNVLDIQAQLHQIEQHHGRLRGDARFAPRTLDLDLIIWGTFSGTLGTLRLPREEILHQAFVLRPLADIAPHERHPLNGHTYEELWAAFDSSATRLTKVNFTTHPAHA